MRSALRTPSGSPRNLLPRVVLLLLLVGLGVYAYRALGISHLMSVDGMRAYLDAHAPYGWVAFCAVGLAAILLQLPPLMPIVIGALLFDGPRAFAFAWIAAMIGSVATFVVARYFAQRLVQRLIGGRGRIFERIRRLDEQLARKGLATVVMLRLVFAMSPPLNWAFAATRVRFLHYVAGTAVGIVPHIAVTVLFAGSLARPDGIRSWPVTLAVPLAVGLLIAACIAGRRYLAATSVIANVQ